MKICFKAKDGGPASKVTGYWLIESKMFFSIVLLRFDKGSREAYHTHAFNAVSWLLKGKLLELVRNSGEPIQCSYTPSLTPIYTPRERFHKVEGIANTTWAISFRGPWLNIWKEFLPDTNMDITLTYGRRAV